MESEGHMVDSDLVKACYRVILGREPESEGVLREMGARLATVDDLLGEFLASEEFRSRLPHRYPNEFHAENARNDQSLSEATRIDVDVSPWQQNALFDRLRRQWQKLGREEPFWSVLTDDKYRASQLDRDIRADFYETHRAGARHVDAFCARNHVRVPGGICVELGCGVGRVTVHLAKRFERVVAIDISEGHLQQCRNIAEDLGIENIEYVLLRSPDELQNIGDYDFFYSMLTLQHNPPPIQKYQLELILSKLRHGGAFLFQAQTSYPQYRFSVEEYLSSPVGTMDMHNLPMREIFSIFERLGLRAREVATNPYTGQAGSYTFFGLAPDGRSGARTCRDHGAAGSGGLLYACRHFFKYGSR
jgi:SAM-dependent methyltransferase